MSYGEARKVITVRLSDKELEQLDALVEAEGTKKRDWWDPAPSRSSVIRAAIADRHTGLEARNTPRARK